VRVVARSEGIGRVPHVRLSVRGPKTMGVAQQSLLLSEPISGQEDICVNLPALSVLAHLAETIEHTYGDGEFVLRYATKASE
jgi:hypothetical protein